METKRLVVVMMMALIAACIGSKGTEVLNPQDSTSQVLYANKTYGFSVSLPEGWRFKEMTAGKAPPVVKMYSDPVGTAKSLVLFEKGDNDLLVLADSLSDGESLVSYATARQFGNDKITSTTIGGANAVMVEQVVLGENNGKVLVEYLDRTNYILIFHLEIVPATGDEADRIANEFNQIVGNVKTSEPDEGSSSSDQGETNEASLTMNDDGSCNLKYLVENKYFVTDTGWYPDKDPSLDMSAEKYADFLEEWKAGGWCTMCNGTNGKSFNRPFKTAQEEENFRINESENFITEMTNKYGVRNYRDYIGGWNGAEIVLLRDDAGACP